MAPSKKFDFIVVGGGTAGCLLANRLASTAKKPSVLLIEAGRDGANIEYRVPYDRFSNQLVPELDYSYKTVPQRALGGAKLDYYRGRGLGGTSLTNFLVWSIGSSADYDRWAELVDDENWAWKITKQRFRKIETFHHTDVPQELKKYSGVVPSDHGYDGPLDVSISPSLESESEIALAAAMELGWPLNLDTNDGNPVGVGLAPLSKYAGLRSTSASANIYKETRPNLSVRTSSRVTKIIFEGTRAAAVQIANGDEVTANSEIILCAGAIDTPKLLLLSGVGPAKELATKNIPIVHDLPGVGKNLQDHCGVFLEEVVSSAYSKRVLFMKNEKVVAAARQQWKKDHTGPLDTHFCSNVVAYPKFPTAPNSEAFQSIDEATRKYMLDARVPSYESFMNAPLLPVDFPFPDPTDAAYFCQCILLMNPQSRGEVALQSSNPDDPPLMEFNYLTHPYDKESIIEAVRQAMQIKKTTTMAKYWKGPLSAPKSESTEDIWEFILNNFSPIWHANGTTMMGKADRSDPLACVDPDLRVFGLKGLRVADLSVCPLTPNGHAQAPAYLIGQAPQKRLSWITALSRVVLI